LWSLPDTSPCIPHFSVTRLLQSGVPWQVWPRSHRPSSFLPRSMLTTGSRRIHPLVRQDHRRRLDPSRPSDSYTSSSSLQLQLRSVVSTRRSRRLPSSSAFFSSSLTRRTQRPTLSLQPISSYTPPPSSTGQPSFRLVKETGPHIHSRPTLALAFDRIFGISSNTSPFCSYSYPADSHRLQLPRQR
jgi:hypothetical protein